MTKGNTTGRGYGHTHQQLRKQWARQVAAGGVKCWRCHELIDPGDPWDFGHDDYDRSLYRGPDIERAIEAQLDARASPSSTPTGS